MGLDFTIYKKRINESTLEAWKVPDFDELRELAYGRKSWELVNTLVPNFSDDEDTIVTMEDWDRLMTVLNPIGPKLNDICEAFHRYNNLPEDFPEYVFGDKEKKLIAEYEYWYNYTFDRTPDLGYDFSASYMLSFWEADQAVRETILDPEWEVMACVSY